MKKQLLIPVIVLLIVGSLLWVACAPAATQTAAPPAATQAPAAATEAPAAATEAPAAATEAPAATMIQLAMVMHQAIPYTAQIKDGFDLFCSQHDDVSCDYAVPDKIDPQTQISMFEAFESKGAQGIVVNCTPADVWVEPVKAARAQGILVNSVDVACLPESNFNVQVGPLYFSQGQVFAKGFFDALKSKGVTSGQVVFGYCAPGYQSQEDRMATLLTECEARGGFDCVGNLDSGHNTDLNYSFWESATIKYPDAVAFAGTCAFDGPNLMKLKALTGGTWEIGTYDLEPETLDGLQSGAIMIAIGNNPTLNGYLATDLLYQNLKDGTTLRQAGLIDTPPELVTYQTIGDYMSRQGDKQQLLDYVMQTVQSQYSDINSTVVDLP